MAKILLINPPWYRFMGMGFKQIPMSLTYLAGTLEARGHEVWVLNADLEGVGERSVKKLYASHDAYRKRINDPDDECWVEVRREIENFRPDLLGVHMKTGSYRSALNTVRLAKEIDPGITTVVGGPHPTLLPEEVAQDDSVDFVVIGEGENTLAELADSGKGSVHSVSGLVYSSEGRIVSTGSRPLIEDIDRMPFPARKAILYKERYPHDAFGIIYSARGCPFQCTYCASSKIWTRRVRFRSPENVLEEIELVYADYGTRYFQIRDDTFTLNKQRAIEICEGIINSGLRITWHCDTRADCVDEDLVRIMKRAGCAHVSVGIESGSDRILQYIKKGETTEQMEEAFRLFRRHGISTSAFIMMGFPGETAQDVQKTLDFARRCRPDFLVLSILTPYPGTEIYDEVVREGKIEKTKNWEVYYHQSPEMGLWDMDPEEERRLTAASMRAVARDNANPLRLAHRFWTLFRRSPSSAIEKALSFIR